ncbi:MAG: VanZ family protein [Thermodesulfobacteriota bacterium]|nr:VanZ family protein [Thermodesulfobacteriota bacterium]
MGVKILLKAMFVVWALAVAVLSVISHPGSKDLLMSVKLTSSGFVVHGVAYFVGILLCYWSFDKKNISFVLWAGLLIFLFSVVLEVVQFYLPYRIFNWYDVVGNCLGVALFVVIMLKQTLKRGKIKKLEY